MSVQFGPQDAFEALGGFVATESALKKTVDAGKIPTFGRKAFIQELTKFEGALRLATELTQQRVGIAGSVDSVWEKNHASLKGAQDLLSKIKDKLNVTYYDSTASKWENFKYNICNAFAKVFKPSTIYVALSGSVADKTVKLETVKVAVDDISKKILASADSIWTKEKQAFQGLVGTYAPLSQKDRVKCTTWCEPGVKKGYCSIEKTQNNNTYNMSVGLDEKKMYTLTIDDKKKVFHVQGEQVNLETPSFDAVLKALSSGFGIASHEDIKKSAQDRTAGEPTKTGAAIEAIGSAAIVTGKALVTATYFGVVAATAAFKGVAHVFQTTKTGPNVSPGEPLATGGAVETGGVQGTGLAGGVVGSVWNLIGNIFQKGDTREEEKQELPSEPEKELAVEAPAVSPKPVVVVEPQPQLQPAVATPVVSPKPVVVVPVVMPQPQQVVQKEVEELLPAASQEEVRPAGLTSAEIEKGAAWSLFKSGEVAGKEEQAPVVPKPAPGLESVQPAVPNVVQPPVRTTVPKEVAPAVQKVVQPLVPPAVPKVVAPLPAASQEVVRPAGLSSANIETGALSTPVGIGKLVASFNPFYAKVVAQKTLDVNQFSRIDQNYVAWLRALGRDKDHVFAGKTLIELQAATRGLPLDQRKLLLDVATKDKAVFTYGSKLDADAKARAIALLKECMGAEVPVAVRSQERPSVPVQPVKQQPVAPAVVAPAVVAPPVVEGSAHNKKWVADEMAKFDTYGGPDYSIVASPDDASFANFISDKTPLMRLLRAYYTIKTQAQLAKGVSLKRAEALATEIKKRIDKGSDGQAIMARFTDVKPQKSTSGSKMIEILGF